MKNRESEEMYLETILRLRQKNINVHSVDVASELKFSRPSVSRGVNLLQKKGYIIFGKNGELIFTEAGEEKANSVYERHVLLTKLLEYVGADKALAEENACRIEHVISPDMFEILKTFSQKL
jgi:Mn-dependent DtxR family transcriptional regulator